MFSHIMSSRLSIYTAKSTAPTAIIPVYTNFKFTIWNTLLSGGIPCTLTYTPSIYDPNSNIKFQITGDNFSELTIVVLVSTFLWNFPSRIFASNKTTWSSWSGSVNIIASINFEETWTVTVSLNDYKLRWERHFVATAFVPLNAW